MRKTLLGIGLLLSVLAFACTVSADSTRYVWYATDTSGGATGALDAVASGVSIGQYDSAIVVKHSASGATIYEYAVRLSSSAESVPDIIAPDDVGIGTTRWHLVTRKVTEKIVASGTTGVMVTEKTGTSGAMVDNSGRLIVGATSLSTNVGQLFEVYNQTNAKASVASTYGYANYAIIVNGTQRAQIYTTDPNQSGNSIFYISNDGNSGKIYLAAKTSAGTAQYAYFDGATGGTFRIYTSGSTYYLGSGTASIFEGSDGKVYACNDAATCVLITSHDDNNERVLSSSNAITGESENIQIGKFFKDAAAGKFANGFKPEDVAKYATFTPPASPEYVKARLLEHEAKELEVWKEHYAIQNTINVTSVVDGNTYTIRPTKKEVDEAAARDFKPNRPKWLKERAGIQ